MKAISLLPRGVCRRPWHTPVKTRPSFLVTVLLGLTQVLPCNLFSYLYAAPTCHSSQPDPSPPPGAPHSASSTSLHSERPHSSAWAGSRPEGLHQRSCSVSSTDHWSEAAALPASMQHPGEWRLSRFPPLLASA